MSASSIRSAVVRVVLGLALVACAQAQARDDARSRAVVPSPARAGAAEVVSGGTVTGDLRVHKGVPSQFLENKRDVFVWLPPGYQGSSARYPVLYMHDGNNCFDARSAFLGREWGADEVMDGLIRAGRINPVIIVGVSNSPARLEEYTWVQGSHDGHPAGGEGQHYARFLAQELKPFIDRAYRTKPERENTAVMGSSLGGLISLYIGIHHADTFGVIGVVSPSLWWHEWAALQDIKAIGPTLRIWLDMGVHEGDTSEQGENLENTRALKRQLVARGYREGLSLGYFEDPQGSHDEPSWSRRLPAIFGFFFRR